MTMTDILSQIGGLSSIAKELGISEADAASGAAALLPAILGGFKKTAQAQPSGLDGLGGILASLGGSGLLDSVLSPAPTNVDAGNGVLGQIFGSKDVSRTVAQSAASQTGLDAGVLKKMLPILAMLVAGYMAKQHATGGPTGADTAATPDAPSGGGLGGLLSGVLGSVMSAATGSAGAGATSGGGGLGGFNRSSQHLQPRGVYGATRRMDDAFDRQGGDALSGGSLASARSRASVLGTDCHRNYQ